MTQQIINIGTSPNDTTGDPLRTAFGKVNANFTELYAKASADVQIPAQGSNSGKYLTTNGTALSWGTVSQDRLVNGSKSVILGTDGNITLPDGGKINTYTSDGSVELQAGGLSGGAAGLVNHNYNNQVQVDDTGVYVMTNVLGPTAYNFIFGTDGNLTLPTGGDIVDNTGHSVLGSTDVYKFANGIIGTKDNPDTGGWGGYAVSIDPGGESYSGISIPSVAAQAIGGGLNIYSTHAGSTIQLTVNSGSVVLWSDGKLTVPGEVSGPGEVFTVTSTITAVAGQSLLLQASPGGNADLISYNSQNAFYVNDTAAYVQTSSGTPRVWTFGTNGSLTFPNTTVQTTAYLGTASTTQIGGVKVDGTSVTINGSGVISLNAGLSGSVTFKGGWDANANTPTLVNGTGTSGWMYIVTTGGTRNLGAGSVVYAASDLLIYDGTNWIKVAANNGVVSFNTRTGAVTLSSTDVTTALGYTPYNSTNPSGYTNNTGTVTSVGGTGTVSGLTLSGSVTISGSLTLGGTLSLTSSNVTTALGFTPYNSTNPSSYITNSSLSVTTNTASGAGSLSYSAGVFTFTPAAAYSLPTATTSVLGGVKVDGTSITITSGVIAVSSALTSATQFKGNWDASANTPALSSSLPAGVAAGWEYIVSASGTRDIGNGSTAWSVGDLVIYDGAKWVRIPSGNNVVSFNTRQGAVTLSSTDVTTALGFTPYNSTNPTGYTTNTGTVTSAGLSLPSQFNVTTNTVTTSGTLTAAWNVQIANRVLAGPATGADAAPTFRALVAADIPSLSYAPTAGSSSITTLGTIATGTWNGSVIAGAYGGTGVANTGKTITLGGNLTTSGAFTTTLTATANTALTLPTTGTLVTLDGTETLTNKTLGATTISGHLIPNTDVTYDLGSGTYRFRDLYLSGSSIKLGGATLTASGSGLVIPAGSTLTTPTISGNAILSGGSLTFSGNISAAAWTTSGIRHVSVAATLTDTSSTGTVANAYTNNFGGNTIAASNAVTYTNYATVFLNDPTAGTNVTITNAYSLITAGNVKLGSTGTGTITAVAATATTNSTAASVGYLGMPQQSKSSAYTTVIGDAGKHIYVTATATITIDSNANVPYPIGTTIAFIAASGATVTIAITSDTMYLGGTGTTGSRTLAAFGMATAVKVTSTSWFINGTGLT